MIDMSLWKNRIKSSKPMIVLERMDGNMIPWKKSKDEDDRYLCSLWWSMFDGGFATLNADGSVSYKETFGWFKKEQPATYLRWNEKDKCIQQSDCPDYEVAAHLPFRSPKEYDEWQESEDDWPIILVKNSR